MSRVEGSYLALWAKYCRFVSPRKTETLGILTPYLKAVPLLYYYHLMGVSDEFGVDVGSIALFARIVDLC